SPEVVVFTKHEVEQDTPNVLICYARKFWPPVLSMTWFKNGQEVSEGVLETVFYPGEDNTFRKFTSLTLVPSPDDYYDCQVQHEGKKEPQRTHW
ncbi:PREDICTED: H-2 class II histocompatibility antigen, E-U alpha chain-like, partial [Acanthisitta chloris]|uniref:H-2 class II histocompatibility antigen, E-U alpha chain-like n=1 Tax=Acanthisitta chloris TaxID=57068 RepID=UPI0004F0F04E